MLFEEFNPYTGLELAKKFWLLASASKVATHVSPVKQIGKDFVFSIQTDLPADNGEKSKKTFEVKVPFSQIEKARVLTREDAKNSKKVAFSTSIETENENDLEVIFTDFLEATQLYDDPNIMTLVSSIKKIHRVEDIQNIIKTNIPK